MKPVAAAAGAMTVASAAAAVHSPRAMQHERSEPAVQIVESAEAAVPILLAELRRAIAAARTPLVGFATGATFRAFLGALAVELEADRLPRSFVATHLDEYVGFPPERRLGMVHELFAACPPLGAMHRAGAFVPVPHVEDGKVIAAHEARLRAMGGVQLQFVGIGRNGHLGFNEPGTPFDSTFHTTELAATTRDDARARFAPDEPPRRAVTSGLATIRSARRVVMCAFGAAKAAAVRAMLTAEPSVACPASALRTHRDLAVVLDHAAAAGQRGGR